MQFVLHHAPVVRRVLFLRKLPMLKGTPDRAIAEVGKRVQEMTFEVGNDGRL